MLAVYPHPNPQGATYKGCYRTGADLALLPAWLFVTSYHLGDYPFDYQKCVDIARSMGFKYAGFNYGTRCLAGMDESLFNGKEISDSYCTTPCDFTSAQRGEQMYGCGGNYAISIYEGSLNGTPSFCLSVCVQRHHSEQLCITCHMRDQGQLQPLRLHVDLNATTLQRIY